MSSSSSFTGDGGAQHVIASQAIWAGSVSAGRCVVTLFLCPALITAAAFLTLYTLLWGRWRRARLHATQPQDDAISAIMLRVRKYRHSRRQVATAG
jgi:hypothetical protein